MTVDNQHISSDPSDRKYFHMMLNMCDDDLDPFQYRLLGHYIRVCGQGGGHCDEGVRATSTATKMHIKTVAKARDELAKLGYIKQRKPSAADARKGKTVYITLIDRWAENVKRYAVAETPQPTIEAVAKMPHLDPKPVADLPQVDEKAVAKMPHKKNYKTQKPKDIKTAASESGETAPTTAAAAAIPKGKILAMGEQAISPNASPSKQEGQDTTQNKDKEPLQSSAKVSPDEPLPPSALVYRGLERIMGRLVTRTETEYVKSDIDDYGAERLLEVIAEIEARPKRPTIKSYEYIRTILRDAEFAPPLAKAAGDYESAPSAYPSAQSTSPLPPIDIDAVLARAGVKRRDRNA